MPAKRRLGDMVDTNEVDVGHEHAHASSAESPTVAIQRPSRKQRVLEPNQLSATADSIITYLNTEFDQYLRFAVPDDQLSQQYTAEVRSHVQAIDSIFTQTREDVYRRVWLLESSVNSLQATIFTASEYWYEHGDLTGRRFSL